MQVFLIFALLLVAGPSFGGQVPCNDAGKIYRVCSDQAQLLSAAFDRAKSEKKKLLVVVGADWCPWCVSLHKLFQGKEFQEKHGQEFVLVDIGLYQPTGQEKVPSGEKALDRLKEWAGVKEKLRGIPLLAMVNPANKKATFINTELLEQNTKTEKGHNAEKVFAAILEAKKAL